jgi:hypothetical protein
MDNMPWIADEARASIEAKLIEAFKTELTTGAARTDVVIDEQRFKLLREELYLYYPDDLQVALPYIMIGFLRFGVPTVWDVVELGAVILFLNIADHPYDDPLENPDDWQRARESAQFKERAVSKISGRQACAIRLWLEAVRDSGIFFPDDADSEHLGYAIAYWSEREGDKRSSE